MLNSSDYPNLKSILVTVKESWTEMDIIKAREVSFDKIESLGIVYPSFYKEDRDRDFNKIDTTGKFVMLYNSSKTEGSFLYDYSDYSTNPKSDDGEIGRSVTYKLEYKKEDKPEQVQLTT